MGAGRGALHPSGRHALRTPSVLCGVLSSTLPLYLVLFTVVTNVFVHADELETRNRRTALCLGYCGRSDVIDNETLPSCG